MKQIEKEKSRFIMKKCVLLAQKGEGKVGNEPLVGVMIYHNDELLSEAFSDKEGDDPILKAIEKTKEKKLLSNSILYINIEPNYDKKIEENGISKIIKYKILKVVIGIPDIYLAKPEKAIEILNNTGTETEINVLIRDCKFVNRKYFYFLKTKKPYIILNYFNDPTDLLNEEIFNDWKKKNYRKEGSILSHSDEIILKNDQLIYSRDEKETPLRVIVDKNLIIPSFYYVLSDEFKSVIFNKKLDKIEENKKYIKTNFNIKENNENYIQNILNYLYKQKISSLIIENNSSLFNFCLENNIWNEINFIESKLNPFTELPILLPNQFLYKKKIEKEIIFRKYTNQE
jgi:diaminohydroxyphosphoribosylaminopyrimidine deaminase/5-amino-6-(5-phosphoribosylamino)uracil reductase